MNRRELLKTLGIGAAGAALSAVPSVEAKEVKETEPPPFQADVFLEAGHPLGWHSKFYLDGKRMDYVYTAAVSYESFERASFGELIIASDENPTSTIMRPGRSDETVFKGYWAKEVSGQVYIELDEQGKEILKSIKQGYE